MSGDTEKDVMKHKIDCDKERLKIRHEFRWEVHGLVVGLDEKISTNREKINNTENKIDLFNQTVNSMQDHLKKIDINIDSLNSKMDKFIETADVKYATKKELQKSEEDITWIRKDFSSQKTRLLWGAIWLIISLISTVFALTLQLINK